MPASPGYCREGIGRDRWKLTLRCRSDMLLKEALSTRAATAARATAANSKASTAKLPWLDKDVFANPLSTQCPVDSPVTYVAHRGKKEKKLAPRGFFVINFRPVHMFFGTTIEALHDREAAAPASECGRKCPPISKDHLAEHYADLSGGTNADAAVSSPSSSASAKTCSRTSMCANLWTWRNIMWLTPDDWGRLTFSALIHVVPDAEVALEDHSFFARDVTPYTLYNGESCALTINARPRRFSAFAYHTRYHPQTLDPVTTTTTATATSTPSSDGTPDDTAVDVPWLAWWPNSETYDERLAIHAEAAVVVSVPGGGGGAATEEAISTLRTKVKPQIGMALKEFAATGLMRSPYAGAWPGVQRDFWQLVDAVARSKRMPAATGSPRQQRTTGEQHPRVHGYMWVNTRFVAAHAGFQFDSWGLLAGAGENASAPFATMVWGEVVDCYTPHTGSAGARASVQSGRVLAPLVALWTDFDMPRLQTAQFETMGQWPQGEDGAAEALEQRWHTTAHVGRWRLEYVTRGALSGAQQQANKGRYRRFGGPYSFASAYPWLCPSAGVGAHTRQQTMARAAVMEDVEPSDCRLVVELAS